MLTVLEFERNIADLKDQCQVLINKAKREKRSLNADESHEFDDKIARAKEIQTEKQRYIEEKGLQEEIDGFRGNNIMRQGESYLQRATSKAGVGPTQDRSYRGMFHKGNHHESLSDHSWENADEFLGVIASQRHDDRLLPGETRSVMTEGIMSDGGFLVPGEFAATWLDTALEGEIVRPRAAVWPMKSSSLKIPGWNATDHTSNRFGFAGAWLAEGATATQQKGKVRQIELTAHKLAIFAQASRELVQDGINYEAQLGSGISEAIGWDMDYAFFQGTGAGRPMGILNDPALIEVLKESGQPANTIIYENLTKMFARMHPACRKRGVWIVNDTAIPDLLALSIAVGLEGSHIPVMSESNGEFQILTRPVIFTEKLPTVGDLGDILFVDLSQYAVGMRQEFQIDRSLAPGWTEDLVDWRIITRVDGQGTWDAAITPKNGDSLSWCVALQAR